VNDDRGSSLPETMAALVIGSLLLAVLLGEQRTMTGFAVQAGAALTRLSAPLDGCVVGGDVPIVRCRRGGTPTSYLGAPP
jgi:hypothetical protein